MLFSVLGGGVSFLSLLVTRWLWRLDPEGLLGILLSVVFFGSLVVGVISFPYGLFLGLRCFFTSIVTPNMRTPEKALKGYLAAIRGDLEERAWNMTTDQARDLQGISLPETSPLTRTMPQPEITDLDSFKGFWNLLGCAGWKAKLRRLERHDIDSRTVVLTCPLQIAHPDDKKQKYTFTAEFPLVRRQNQWFLANTFVWEQTGGQ